MGRTASFALGVCLAVQLPALWQPSVLWLLGGLAATLAAWSHGRALALLGCLALGAVWLQAHGHWRLSQALPEAWQRVELRCEGRVLEPAQRRPGRWRFTFALERCRGEHDWQALGQRVRLSWYRPAPTQPRPLGGERWQLALKLKPPRGALNPGGFDYETWLFQRGLQATGYVLEGPAQRLQAAPWWSLAGWREALRERLDAQLPARPEAGVIGALVLADRSAVDPAMWRRFREAGTAHLLAISGLHVGLMAALGALWGGLAWRLAGALSRRGCGPRALWVGGWGLLAAGGYAALAGFALPTVRALVMLAAAAAFAASGRHRRGLDVLAAAFLALLLVDPLSVLSAGFWLSFCAVAGILVGLSARRHWGRWRQMLWVNAAMGLVLAPLGLLAFGQLAWWCSAANLLVVPVFSVAVVPLSLLGALLASLDWPGAATALAWAAELIGWCDAWQAWLLRLPQPPLVPAGVAPLGLLLLSGWLLSPALWRGAGLLLLAAAVLLASPRRADLPPGGFVVTALDVGHGLAVLVETAEHLLVYDTGPRYGGGRSSGEAVVAPALRAAGWRAPDTVLVSHGDSDHAGGLPALRRLYPGARVLAAGDCPVGRRWRWDGVVFELLHPRRPLAGDNDNSCVLRVHSPLGSALLPGDVERRAERRMLAGGTTLASELLLVPHHGSNSSSSRDWLRAVAPSVAVISVDRDSRWGMPHAPVLARLRAVGAQVWSTGEAGAVTVRFAGRDAEVSGAREQRRRFWHGP